ncbi:MAG: radical SAM protein [Deltaproteobacteria bacterium]|nr:radical SAM protein [Deltaproteobacteria bacterium]
MRLAVITPPPLKPSEPGLSGAAAASVLSRLGADATWIDASAEWHRFALQPDRLAAALAAPNGTATVRGGAFGRAIDAARRDPPALRLPGTYSDRPVYTSAVNDLENALRLAALPWPGWRLGVAMAALDRPTRRLESTAVLEWAASTPGPFDAYLLEDLLPRLARDHFDVAAVSLTFQQQGPAAFRLAHLLREGLPNVRRVLGGPLVSCWLAAGFDIRRAPFDRFHQVVAGSDEDLGNLVRGSGSSSPLCDSASLRETFPPKAPTTAEPPSPAREPLVVPLDDAPWDAYLSPKPIVPAALGRGCSWRRCAFCPDHLHPAHQPCSPPELARWLRRVAARFPQGAMLHLTDSSLPPDLLAHVADVIRDERLPLAWHGFVRVDAAFADPAFARRLAEGGCAMLQLGVESGSPRILERLGKGAAPDLARNVLRATAAAGIRNQIYLLFGVPGETDEDREATLDLVAGEAERIHACNAALLNLPKGSPMHRRPERFGITELLPFGEGTDLSLYDDFRCGVSLPRREARRWLARRFFKSPAVRAIDGRLRSSFKANHLCFL